MTKETCDLSYAVAQHLLSKGKDDIAGESRRHNALVITGGTAQSHELLRQLKFFIEPNQNDDYKDEWFQDNILIIPDNEILAYDSFSPDPHTTSRRIRAFYRMLAGDYQLAIASVKGLLSLVAPPQYFVGRGLSIKKGQQLDYSGFVAGLTNSGYKRQSYVTQPGDIAVRGAIVDIFPMASDTPYRIEWLDDEIESLRSFDVRDQLSIDRVEEINIVPSTEFPVEQQAVARFIKAWQASFTGSARHHPIYIAIKEGRLPAGIEAFLPLFFTVPLASYFDYMEHIYKGVNQPGVKGYQVFYPESIMQQGQTFIQDATTRWNELGGENAVLLPPVQLFMSCAELETKLHTKENLFAPRALQNYMGEASDLMIDINADNKLARLLDFSSHYKGKILLSLSSAKRYELICDWLARAKVNFHPCDSWHEFIAKADDAEDEFAIIHSQIQEGMITDDWAIICEEELFGNFISAKQSPRRSLGAGLDADDVHELGELRALGAAQFTPGELVIHSDYGLGLFLGLEKFAHGNYSGEYIVIEYAEETKLFLPVYNLQLLSSYSSVVASGQEYPLDKLGGKNWSKRKAQALAKIEDTAASLLDIYAQRERTAGIVFAAPDKDYEEFTLGFPYQETDGQAQSIKEVIRDMVSNKKTDRLICGDVGFGKTEIAMRAAYLAAASGYQVAILTPTTLLASQHLINFRARFAKTPLVIGELSRLSGKSKDIISSLADGKIDIVIGTHALLGEKIKFHKLGLVIVDEEHRFGVRQKERLKSLHKQVDIISLSATPIPRTLNLALSGLRDISLLATAPPGRLPIMTYSGLYNDNLIKEAIQRELMRDGQIYYIYNDIAKIYARCEYLREFFPTATIEAVHGRLDKQEMENIMYNFYNNKISILVCTTIIENGLDAPNANTLIVTESQRFGLSQLHQLRGRVGRRKRQAFAYLMVSDESNTRAAKRIKAIQDNSALGGGFNLASYDLEVRGAGQILGAEQSGFMQKVGLELYTQMLEEAVYSLSHKLPSKEQGKTDNAGDKHSFRKPLSEKPRSLPNAQIDLAVSAFFPDDYIEDVVERMKIYKRLTRCDSNALEKMERNIVDIYGALPLYAANLFELHKLRIKASEYAISHIKIARSNGYLRLTASPNDEHSYQATQSACAKLAVSEPDNYLFKNDNLHFRCENPMHHLTTIAKLLKHIQQLSH